MRKHTVLLALGLMLPLMICIPLATIQVMANAIPVDVDIDPDSLHLKDVHCGRWITAYIWFSEDDHDVNDINVSSILLEVMGYQVPASRHDVQGNVLMVKFDRAMVTSFLWSMIAHMSPHTKQEATLTVTGELRDGEAFKGSDTIEVFYTHL